MADFRALCAELTDTLDYWLKNSNLTDSDARDLVQEARAALAQPEPVAPTDEEIEEWADASSEVPLEEMDPEVHGWRRCFTKEEFGASIRAALARWGTPAIEPVAPTDEELIAAARKAVDTYLRVSELPYFLNEDSCEYEPMLLALHAAARWSMPTNNTRRED